MRRNYIQPVNDNSWSESDDQEIQVDEQVSSAQKLKPSAKKRWVLSGKNRVCPIRSAAEFSAQNVVRNSQVPVSAYLNWDNTLTTVDNPDSQQISNTCKENGILLPSDLTQTFNDSQTGNIDLHSLNQHYSTTYDRLKLESEKTFDFVASPGRRWRMVRGREPVITREKTLIPVALNYIQLYRQMWKYGVNREQLLNEQTKDLTGLDKYKYQSSKRLKKTRSRVGEVFSRVEIWRGAFKTVEGNFGSSIVAYFRFVKWLFLMNLFTFLMILAVIVLPQEIMEPKTFNDTMDGINQDELQGHYEYNSEALVCSANYTETIDQVTQEQNVGMDVLDFFLGTGWMEETVLFAGYYFNKTMFYEVDEEDSNGDPVIGVLYYNMPLAYVLTTAIYFIIILILMVSYTGKGVKDRLVNSGDKFNRCCNMIFCGWDYNLSTDKAAKLQHKNLANEFTNEISEARLELLRKNMPLKKRICVFIVRVLIWCFVFVVWGASFYLIAMVVGTWVPALLEKSTVTDSWILVLIVEILPSITITAINVVAAPLFQIIVRFEDYSPETEVRVTIARTVILRLASIGVLSFTLHSRITSCDGNDPGPVCGNCEPIQCWETYVGQEYYKLVLVDFFVIVAITFLVEFPRKLMVTKFSNNFIMSKVGLQEFELPKNVLEIVYTQTISWIGGFFAPLIPAITVIKLFIFFYVKKLSLMQNCIPAAKPYRASKSNYFFMIILMVSYGLCLIILSYAIGRIPPSQSCGPWRVYSQDEYYIYTTVTDAIKQLPEGIETVFEILTNWILYVLLLIILCLIIYYYQAISSGNKRKVELLKEQLALEGMDKQFLLQQVNMVLHRTATQPVQ